MADEMTPEEMAVQVTTLTQNVADRDKAFGELKETHAGELSTAQDAHTTALGEAVESYRGAVVAANPTIPPAMITGASVAEIDAAVVGAQATVEQVKQTLAAEAIVGPGAPARTGPDVASMTPAEKITHGLNTQPYKIRKV